MKNTIQRWGGYVLFIVGVILFAVGRMNGEDAVVLHKAVNICLECIGIG